MAGTKGPVPEIRDRRRIIAAQYGGAAQLEIDVVAELFGGAAQYDAIAVSRRASIEHCELVGAAKLVQAVAECKTEDAELLVVSIDWRC